MNASFLNFYNKDLILASRSPRRREILKMVGLEFNVSPSNYKETFDDQKSPVELARYHAFMKSKKVAQNFDNSWILGADTIVVLDNEILEKPEDQEDACNMLNKLSGRTHKVITGFTIMNSSNGEQLSSATSTEVTFNELSPEMINYYLDNYNYRDKAGSYAIQDFSAVFVKKINGCFYNVVGFPISDFCNLVRNSLVSCL
jgi:septum formation protein